MFSPFSVINGYRWTEFGSPVELSHSVATPFFDSNNNIEGFTWIGFMDTVSRANASDHYIGRQETPPPAEFWFIPEFHGPITGMIDGQAVDFEPEDLNEEGVVVGNRIDGPMVIRTLPAPPLAAIPDVLLPGAYPKAINTHMRPAPTPSGSPSPAPTPVPVPQILGWDGSTTVLWERQPDTQIWHPFGLEEMIPAMDGWEIWDITDLNDDGVVVGSGSFRDPNNPQTQSESHAFMLVPIGFRARNKAVTVRFGGADVELKPDGINQGFDPRVTQDDPWPWASVVKGGISNVVKLVLPENAAQMKLVVVVAEGSGTPTIDVTPKDGLRTGDNDITLSSSADGDSIATATVEVHMFNDQGSDTGEVIAKLHVMALPPRTVSLGIYRVKDPSSAAQDVGGPDTAQIKATLESIYQQAGVNFEITSPESAPMNISYDTYESPNVAAGDGRVQEEEFAFIAGDSRTQAGRARLFLAANSGVASDESLPLNQRRYARGLTPPGRSYSFVFTQTGHNDSLIAQLNSAHELGHVLGLSKAPRLDDAQHDLGPFPPETLETDGGVMHPGTGDDQPGRWLGHEDWRQANERAETLQQ